MSYKILSQKMLCNDDQALDCTQMISRYRNQHSNTLHKNIPQHVELHRKTLVICCTVLKEKLETETQALLKHCATVAGPGFASQNISLATVVVWMRILPVSGVLNFWFRRKVCHWGQTLRFQGHMPFPVRQKLLLVIQDLNCQLLAPTAVPTLTLWNHQ